EGVVPQAGDHQDVGLADAGRERLRIAYRETPDAGPERGKPLVQPVSDMGETDDELILRRDHRGLRITRILAAVSPLRSPPSLLCSAASTSGRDGSLAAWDFVNE